MSWARFEILVPIVLIVLTHIGTRWLDAGRYRRERERTAVDRRSELEHAALVELQDLMDVLPRTWTKAITGANGAVSAVLPHQQISLKVRSRKLLAQVDQATAARNHALTLASRVLDDDLRQFVADEIDAMCPMEYDGTSLGEWDITKGPVPYVVAQAWEAASRASSAIGERLRRLPDGQC